MQLAAGLIIIDIIILVALWLDRRKYKLFYDSFENKNPDHIKYFITGGK